MSKKINEICYLAGDFHIPYHDEGAIQAFISSLKKYKPKEVVLLGDQLDCYSLSSFSKRPDRLNSLKDEIKIFSNILKEIRKAVPAANITVLEGNHCFRLGKYLRDKAPALWGLEDLSWESLLGLDKLNIHWIPYGQSLKMKGFVVVHGTLVRNKSGATAHSMIERYGTSGVSGHVHRLAIVYHTNATKTMWWAEAGCLCSLNQEYLLNPPDWQQGWVVVENGQPRLEVYGTHL